DRSFLGAQRVCGLTVGKADDVDRYERFTKRPADPLKRRVDGSTVEGLADRIAPLRYLVDLVTGRDGRRPRRPGGADPRVPHCAKQISQIMVAACETGTAENLLERVLDEILGVLARPAQRIRGAVQGRYVPPKRLRVQPTAVAGRRLGRTLVLIESH